MRDRPQLIADGNVAAVSELLKTFYPPVFRLAAALTGDLAVAEMLSSEVLRRSLRQLHRWHDPAAAERWFPHMAVLLAREVRPISRPILQSDPSSALFVLNAAVATLPVQQREAILLHYGEHCEARQMATAMDCSATAASNHLAAAIERLRPVAGDGLDGFLLALPEMLASLVPPPGEVRLRVEQQVRQSRWAARLRRVVKWLIALAALAAAATVALHGRALLNP